MLKESKLLFRMALFYLLEKRALQDFVLYNGSILFLYLHNKCEFILVVYISNSICPLQNKARQNCKTSEKETAYMVLVYWF